MLGNAPPMKLQVKLAQQARKGVLLPLLRPPRACHAAEAR
jgi:hypothetical protein